MRTLRRHAALHLTDSESGPGVLWIPAQCRVHHHQSGVRRHEKVNPLNDVRVAQMHPHLKQRVQYRTLFGAPCICRAIAVLERTPAADSGQRCRLSVLSAMLTSDSARSAVAPASTWAGHRVHMHGATATGRAGHAGGSATGRAVMVLLGWVGGIQISTLISFHRSCFEKFSSIFTALIANHFCRAAVCRHGT